MKQRLITGICLAVVSLLALYLGFKTLFWGLLIVSSLINYELLTINPATKFSVLSKGIGLIAVPVLSVLYLLSSSHLFLINCVMIIIHLLLSFELRTGIVSGANNPTLYSLRSLYLSITVFGIFFIRHFDNSFLIVIFFLTCIWMTDSMAYFGGKLLGKRPFSQYSPNKTIEGSIIGIVSTIIYATLMTPLLDWPFYFGLIFGFFIAIISQIGDLHESLTKRYFKVKDSSNFLPGHGGFYDRLDSTIAVIPFVILFLELLP